MVSAAHRTIGTWESVAAGGGFDLEPYLSEVLYGAGPETALDLLREAPDDVTAVIVIGHNPTMASLASLIDDGDGDPAVTSEMLAGYPTSAVALFEYDGPWSDLTEAGARLVAYHVGRGLAESRICSQTAPSRRICRPGRRQVGASEVRRPADAPTRLVSALQMRRLG